MEKPVSIDLEIKGGHILTLDEQFTEWNPGTVCISGNHIVYLGPDGEKPSGYHALTTLNATGKVVMPTFFNGHTHAAMSMFRGLADDLTLHDWLNRYIWPAERKNVKPETVFLGTMISAIEMIRSGTSSFADMYFFEEEVARASEECGIRAILGSALFDFPAPDSGSPDVSVKRTHSFYQKYRNHPLISIAVAAHAPYTCSPQVIRAAAELSAGLNIPASIHLAEAASETELIRERYGKSPTRYLFDLGFLSPRTVAHHGIHLSGEDIDLIARSGTSICTIPNSNMKLGSGLCPVPRLISQGINVAIGTDGAASNNNQSMVRDLQLLGRVQKAYHEDPAIISAGQLLQMATIGGARAYGRADQLGSLATGKLADLMIINPDQPHWYPRYHPVSTIAYCMHSEDVESVIINGRVVMDHRQLTRVDEEKYLWQMKNLKLVF